MTDRVSTPTTLPGTQLKPILGPRAEWPIVMMEIARAVAARSRDATTRVGAVVCDSGNRVLGTGYNGGPRGSQPDLPNSGVERHPFTIHAEINALLQTVATLGSIDLAGCVIYCTHRPCAACVKMAAHLGIKGLLYLVDELDSDQFLSSNHVANVLGVNIVKITLTGVR